MDLRVGTTSKTKQSKAKQSNHNEREKKKGMHIYNSSIAENVYWFLMPQYEFHSMEFCLPIQ